MAQNHQIDGKFLAGLALRFRLCFRPLGTPLRQNVVKKIIHSQKASEVEQASAPIEFQTRYCLAIKSCPFSFSAKRGPPIGPDKIETEWHRQDRDYDHEPFLMFTEYVDHCSAPVAANLR